MFCTLVWALYYVYILIEVTMSMAKYTSGWQSAAGAAKECQYLYKGHYQLSPNVDENNLI